MADRAWPDKRRNPSRRRAAASGGEDPKADPAAFAAIIPASPSTDAYAIQKAWIEIKVAEGRVVKGHKIGLTSKAMQSALDIDEPDSGVLLDDMFFADGGLVPTDRFIGTRVEAELAFIMKPRLAGPDCTMFDVLNATDFVVPALEILDTRIERVDPQTKVDAKDLRYHRRQRRQRRHRARRPPDCARSMPICAGSARCAIVTASWKKPGSPPACSIIPPPAWPGSPTRSQPTGLRSNPGQVVLAGSFIRPIETRKGDTIQADYGPYGTVSCYFA